MLRILIKTSRIGARRAGVSLIKGMFYGASERRRYRNLVLSTYYSAFVSSHARIFFSFSVLGVFPCSTNCKYSLKFFFEYASNRSRRLSSRFASLLSTRFWTNSEDSNCSFASNANALSRSNTRDAKSEDKIIVFRCARRPLCCVFASSFVASFGAAFESGDSFVGVRRGIKGCWCSRRVLTDDDRTQQEEADEENIVVKRRRTRRQKRERKRSANQTSKVFASVER